MTRSEGGKEGDNKMQNVSGRIIITKPVTSWYLMDSNTSIFNSVLPPSVKRYV